MNALVIRIKGVSRETQKAFRLEVPTLDGSKQFWFPKSQIRLEKLDGEQVAFIPYSLAVRSGVINVAFVKGQFSLERGPLWRK